MKGVDGPVVVGNGTHNYRDHKMIHLAELETVVVMVKEVDKFCEERGASRPDLFVVGIDSNVAKGMILQKYAKKPGYRKLFEVLDGRKISLSYVKSEENPADEPSRFEYFNQKKWDDLFRHLAAKRRGSGSEVLQRWETDESNNTIQKRVKKERSIRDRQEKEVNNERLRATKKD